MMGTHTSNMDSDKAMDTFLSLYKAKASKKYIDGTTDLLNYIKELYNKIKDGAPLAEISRRAGDVVFYGGDFERAASVYFATDPEKLEKAQSILPELIRISSAIHDGLSAEDALKELDQVIEIISQLAFG